MVSREVFEALVNHPSLMESGKGGGYMQIAFKLIEDALNETSYLADVAGLHATVSSAASYILRAAP